MRKRTNNIMQNANSFSWQLILIIIILDIRVFDTYVEVIENIHFVATSSWYALNLFDGDFPSMKLYSLVLNDIWNLSNIIICCENLFLAWKNK